MTVAYLFRDCNFYSLYRTNHNHPSVRPKILNNGNSVITNIFNSFISHVFSSWCNLKITDYACLYSYDYTQQRAGIQTQEWKKIFKDQKELVFFNIIIFGWYQAVEVTDLFNLFWNTVQCNLQVLYVQIFLFFTHTL